MTKLYRFLAVTTVSARLLGPMSFAPDHHDDRHDDHRFEPTDFYNTFSGAHKPVLRIKPGDHVVTFTIDSHGVDAAGVQRGQRSNPETGPFYIEGAEPGDTLVVHLLRLETNRATGFSASLLDPYTADPGFLRQGCAERTEDDDVADR